MMQPAEKPGEVLAQFKGEGRLKFFFLTKEGLPLPEGSWVKAKTDKNRVMSMSLDTNSPSLLNSSSPTASPVHAAMGRDSVGLPSGAGGAKPRPESVQKAGAAIIGLRERMERRMTMLKDEHGNFKAGNKPIQTLSSSPSNPSPIGLATAQPAAPATVAPVSSSPPPAASSNGGGGGAFRLDENFNLDAYATVQWADLRLGKKIGEGQYGVVSKGTYFDTTVAIKQLLEVEGETFEQTLKYIKRELWALMELRHPNIVQFMGYGVQPQPSGSPQVYIVTEFIDGGDLHLLLKTHSIELPWNLRIAMSADIARAMCFLHAINWVHRDLKTENLLVDRNGKLKICDLGLARKLKPQEKTAEGTYMGRAHAMTVCGTNEFMSPEMILGMPYDKSTDVFSYGIILGEIITRREPSERDPEIGYQVDWAELRQSVPRDCPPEFLQLMSRCCAPEAAKRPTFQETLNELVRLGEIYAPQ